MFCVIGIKIYYYSTHTIPNGLIPMLQLMYVSMYHWGCFSIPYHCILLGILNNDPHNHTENGENDKGYSKS